MERGTIFKFHNDLDTDQIIASQYLLLPNLDEMKDHAFESLDPDFAKKVKPGDFVVGGENFGCGSSREQAPGVLKALGALDQHGINCHADEDEKALKTQRKCFNISFVSIFYPSLIIF